MLKQEITDEDFILDKQPKKQLNSFFFFLGGGGGNHTKNRKGYTPLYGNWILRIGQNFVIN